MHQFFVTHDSLNSARLVINDRLICGGRIPIEPEVLSGLADAANRIAPTSKPTMPLRRAYAAFCARQEYGRHPLREKQMLTKLQAMVSDTPAIG